MLLQPGSRLGAFDIIGPIGSGGMGEVYRARDTKLGREVAIKTLPPAVADDQHRLARFQREAKLLASLNHAHIASVYDLDEQDGTLYIAMELVEGETLEAKLLRGALQVERALQLGLQVAEALEAAHEKGVVHRDLKPANIMVTADDVVQVLDFGLAKAISPGPGQPISANSPTLSMAMTQQGLILGTAGYMSPEQASGQATDQRADIWAFGVVLYEMLTGRPVFSGESVPHVLAAVLKTEPDWSRLPEGLPYRLRQTLERCLEKKVRDRYHSIADVRVDLEKILKAPAGSDATLPMGAMPAETRYPRLSWFAAGVAVALVAGFAGWWLRPTDPAPPLRQFPVDLGIEGVVAAGMMPDWAPDESEVAFVAEYADGTTGLIRYLIADGSVHEVPGTEGASSPFYSPDGDWIGFIRDGRPLRIRKAGGEPLRLDPGSLESVAAWRGASWFGNVILIAGGIESFFGVPLSGGPETDFPNGLYYPDVLPGGQTALFTFREGISDFATARIDLISLTNPEEVRTTLIDRASYARYLPSGYLIFVRDGTMYAAPFDPDRPAAFDESEAVQLRFNVAYDVGGRASMAFGASTGIAVYRPGSGAANRSFVDLVWVDADGAITELPNLPRSDTYRWVRYSPSGDRLAVIQGLDSADSNLLIYNVKRESLRTLVRSERIDSYIWIDDGHIFYNSTDGVHRVAVDTGETALLVESEALPPGRNLLLAGASADRLMVSGETEDNLLDIWMASIERNPAPTIGAFEAFRTTPEFEALPAFSRDGQFVAYILSGGNVMISGYPYGQRRPVSDANIPLWSQNSDQLFVLDGTRRIMVIDYVVEDGILIPETQRPWGAGIELVNPGTAGHVYVYSRDPNRDRFAVLLPPNDTSAAGTEVRFILDISREIERALGQLN